MKPRRRNPRSRLVAPATPPNPIILILGKDQAWPETLQACMALFPSASGQAPGRVPPASLPPASLLSAPPVASAVPVAPAASSPASAPLAACSTLQLTGWFGSEDARELRLGEVRVYPDPRDFAFLYILACHALTRAGLPTPREIRGPEYLPTQSILAEFDQLKREVVGLAGLWDNAIFTHVHRLAYRLRGKIEQAFRRVFAQPPGWGLIESGPRGGYRLSIPSGQIQLKPVSLKDRVPPFRPPGGRSHSPESGEAGGRSC
jgi:hypothetical protein